MERGRSRAVAARKGASIQQIVLPELYYPFAPAISEHADTVHRSTVSWACRFGLLPSEKAYLLFRSAGIGRLVARTHPDSPLEDLRLISDWYSWLFIRDDVRDDSEVGRNPEKLSCVDGRLLDVLEGAEPENEEQPLVHALRDLRDRLLARLRARSLSRAWMRRFERAVREHLESTLWEASNRARGATPDLDSYVRMRPLTGGLSIITELVEIVEGTHLPAEVRGHAAVRRLTDASHNVVCWANDILSLEKELSRGDVNNLVVVLRHSLGLDLQRAVERAAEMHDAEMRTFVDLSARLPSFGIAVDANLGRYVAALRSRMRGVFDWSYESRRYGTPPRPGAGPWIDPSTTAARRG
jgi:5-epi-alpha-selinene synthase